MKPRDSRITTRARELDLRNLLAARVILEDPELYAGLPVIWARAVIARLDLQSPRKKEAA